MQKNNETEKRFLGKTPINSATSFFFFEKGSKIQRLMHELKYRNNKEIGRYLSKIAATELSQSGYYSDVNVIVPVPLHPKKELLRGYNQSEWIGKGLSDILDKPLDINNLVRMKENISQTKKTVYERFENTQGVFAVRQPTRFTGKHILLVDDILTTGSTLEACATALQECKNVKISIFTLAVAK
ncbi:MAG: ComF family protein [Paludibacteraceae bacterium]